MFLKKSKLTSGKIVGISGSKSISNRLLILKYCFDGLQIKNLSTAEDTVLLHKALLEDNSIIDVHHAGTAFRFLTSYFSILKSETHILTGSERLQQRPIKDLVDALVSIGAKIEYLGETGYPPIKIIGTKIIESSVKINGNISSQFITSLLLIAAKLENGLTVEIVGKITSKPYLEMTISLLTDLGIDIIWQDNNIVVKPLSTPLNKTITIESDWSSASYFYSLVAIGKKEIGLCSFTIPSLQGDSVLMEIYRKYFGVDSVWDNSSKQIQLKPIPNFEYPSIISLNLNNCPDIAQTICVTATILKIPFHFTGLETLKIKETDRLVALQNELLKIGCKTTISDEGIFSDEFVQPLSEISIETYSDHRMAMSFAPYCLEDTIQINDPKVVEKSYPNFWKDLQSITTII
ncbi:MAG: 3-phosphoshikimate 1-carboxyvinyltransferase [Bacteroidetes bacterium]|nr:3-phosphoshikimate 1-carboxyvinyltransferase [Bacteroidota bacterium]